ncbi:hypothetical protein OROGR_008225 [Orobanche gracilis]
MLGVRVSVPGHVCITSKFLSLFGIPTATNRYHHQTYKFQIRYGNLLYLLVFLSSSNIRCGTSISSLLDCFLSSAVHLKRFYLASLASVVWCLSLR